jgi:phage major head subunit gpT-like protein
MLITPQNLNVFFTALETRFWTALGAAPLFYNKLTTTYPVSTEIWLTGWVDMIDKARVWVGPRITRTPAPITYQVPIQPFELTESIDLFKLQDDQYGLYNPVVSFMGLQMAKWPDYQVRDLLQNQGYWTNSYQNGYDGLSFFNTAHQNDFYDASKGTFPNDYTGGGVTVNSILIGGGLAPNAFATVYEDMSRRKTASGEPWGIMPDLLATGPMLKLTADTILQAQFMGLPVVGNIGTQATANPANPNQTLVGATENVMKSYADRLMWPDLGGSTSIGGGTYDSVWYLFDTSKPVKALSWLLRMAPDFVYRTNPDDPIVFDTHTVAYGSKARGAPAWGFHQLASRSGP